MIIEGTSLGIKGWSKRVANAKARQESEKRMHDIDAVRQAHYAAVRAGFRNVEEQAAHHDALAKAAAAEADATLAAEMAAKAAAEAAAKAAEAAVVTEEPVVAPATDTAPEAPKKAARRKTEG